MASKAAREAGRRWRRATIGSWWGTRGSGSWRSTYNRNGGGQLATGYVAEPRGSFAVQRNTNLIRGSDEYTCCTSMIFDYFACPRFRQSMYTSMMYA